MKVRPEAEEEQAALPAGELVAMDHAIQKLRVAGERLGFPHTSAVKGSPGLRELRPRQGRSPWRAFYGRVRGDLIVAAVGPEAQVDPRGFARATARAVERLADEEAQTEQEADEDG